MQALLNRARAYKELGKLANAHTDCERLRTMREAPLLVRNAALSLDRIIQAAMQDQKRPAAQTTRERVWPQPALQTPVRKVTQPARVPAAAPAYVSPSRLPANGSDRSLRTGPNQSLRVPR